MSRTQVTPASNGAVQPSPRRARLLIIDDEPKLLRTYSILLGREYEVVVAESGEKAMALVEREPAFDVIVCDLLMPGMDGIEVYEQLRTQAPALADRIVFSTGSVFQARAREFLSRYDVPLLEKPVHLEALMEAIDKRLHPPSALSADAAR